MTVAQLQEAYLEDLVRQRRSHSTLASNRRWLNAYCEFAAAHRVGQLHELTPELLPALYQSLLCAPGNKRRRYSANSLYQMVQMVRAFLHWAFTQGYLEQDLVADLVLPRSSPAACLTLAELAALQRQQSSETALGLRDRALMEIFYEAELSKEQAHRLDLQDVRLSERQVRVADRSEKPVWRTVTARLATALSAYLERGRSLLGPAAGEKAVFLTRSGGRLGPDAIAARIKSLGQRAGLAQTLHPRLLVASGQAHRRAKR